MKQWSSLSAILVLLLIACAVWIWVAPSRLQYEWLAVAATLTSLCAAAGILVNGRPDGIFIDDRNRMSLSRLQWVAWLVVLMSGYYTGAMLDAAAGKALPGMQVDLFALLGIVSGSAIASSLIVDNKKTSDSSAEPLQVGKPGQIGKMDANATPAEANWADLYYGEEAANRNVVDISRLQKLVITTLLLMTYARMLWAAFGASTGARSFPHMPQIDETFTGLLAASHAAYLAFKATPKTPASAAHTAAAISGAVPGSARCPPALRRCRRSCRPKPPAAELAGARRDAR